ncbi:MAG: hypothetical protein V2A79_01010 [Planctomycetota bacterium]
MPDDEIAQQIESILDPLRANPQGQPLPPDLWEKLQFYSQPKPIYAAVKSTYEPIYMWLFRKPVGHWIDSDISGPSPLRCKPRTQGEVFYVKYINPNRILTINILRLLIQFGVVILITGGLFLALRGRRGYPSPPPAGVSMPDARET